MDKKLKNKWIRALTGKLKKKYVQGSGRLKTFDNKFCCLGVLADIQGCRWTQGNDGYIPILKDVENSGADYLQSKFSAGIRDKSQKKLAEMNDGGESFEEIAAYIKKRYK